MKGWNMNKPDLFSYKAYLWRQASIKAASRIMAAKGIDSGARVAAMMKILKNADSVYKCLHDSALTKR